MNRKIITYALITGLSLTAVFTASTYAEASYRAFLRDYVNQQQQPQQQTPQQQTPQQESTGSRSILDNFWANRRNRTSQPTQTTQTTQTTQPESRSNHVISQRERDMLRWVNEERAKVGAPPLQLDQELSRWAKIKSEDMRDDNYFSHTSPTYGNPIEMMRNAGIQFTRGSENISSSQSAQISHHRLMASEGHRRNILNPNFTHIGIGIIDQNPSGVLVTQLFIQR